MGIALRMSAVLWEEASLGFAIKPYDLRMVDLILLRIKVSLFSMLIFSLLSSFSRFCLAASMDF